MARSLRFGSFWRIKTFRRGGALHAFRLVFYDSAADDVALVESRHQAFSFALPFMLVHLFLSYACYPANERKQADRQTDRRLFISN